MIRPAGQGKHKLVSEEGDCGVTKSAKAGPFQDAGFPERHRQRHAHHELNQRRQRYRLYKVLGLVREVAQPVSFTRAIMLIDDHYASPKLIDVKAPASIMPATLAAISNEAEDCSAEA